MILSILIPSLYSRKEKLDSLLSQLGLQAHEDVEILYYQSGSEQETGITTGEKRNHLISIANGKYCSFIDDDDRVSSSYVKNLLYGINLNVDAVTFKGQILTGSKAEIFELKLGNPYSLQPLGRIRYLRPPNHLCAIKTDILRRFPFPAKTRAEDFEQCINMKDAGAIRTEHHIEQVMYYYMYEYKQTDLN